MTSSLLFATALAAALSVAAAAQAAPGPDLSVEGRLMQITLPVKDLDRSVAFYRDSLGMTVRLRGKRAAMMLDAGGFSLRLEQSDKVEPGEGVEIYFSDPGLSRFKALSERGVKFIGPPEIAGRLDGKEIRLAEFTDPDGHAVGLMGEAPQSR